MQVRVLMAQALGHPLPCKQQLCHPAEAKLMPALNQDGTECSACVLKAASSTGDCPTYTRDKTYNLAYRIVVAGNKPIKAITSGSHDISNAMKLTKAGATISLGEEGEDCPVQGVFSAVLVCALYAFLWRRCNTSTSPSWV